MNRIKHAAWLLTALLCLAYSAWCVLGPSESKKLDSKTLSALADTYITELTVLEFDSLGKLNHYLQTPLLSHTPLNNIHQLTSPHIILSEDTQPQWEIHSKEATATHGGQEITFSHDVIIHQNKSEKSEETTLKTDEMTYFPKDKLATTPLDVLFIQAGTQVQSTGMRAYLAENRVQLLSHARGTYEPLHG